MKTLSIVVPVYNTEIYIERCLLSLTFDEEALEEIEVIVVNDGGKDGALKIAQKFKKKYPDSFVIIDKENGGHGSTINSGLAVATGKYLRVVDSDDWVNIDDFGPYIKALKKRDEDAVITNYTREMIYNGTKEKFEYSKSIKKNHTYQFDKFDLTLLKDDYLFMATTAFKTERLREAKLRLDEKMFYVDMEYITLPIEKISSFAYLDFDIYRYFIGRSDQSIDIKNMVKNRHQHEKVLKRLLDFYLNTKLSVNKKKYLRKILTLMINTHYYIYCARKIDSKSMRQEIKVFDKFLLERSPELYNAVANKFSYIAHHRKTNFAFTRVMHSVFRKYVTWHDFRVKPSEEDR